MNIRKKRQSKYDALFHPNEGSPCSAVVVDGGENKFVQRLLVRVELRLLRQGSSMLYKNGRLTAS